MKGELAANDNSGRNRVIYNYPAVAGGIDLTSDDVVDIARAAPNVCGIMLSLVLLMSLLPYQNY